jgi:hypothetical protein
LKKKARPAVWHYARSISGKGNIFRGLTHILALDLNAPFANLYRFDRREGNASESRAIR